MTLRAGPDTGYPRIRTLATGTPVAARGCIDDYLGCDVVAHGDRGWVAGDYVAFEYDDRPVHVADYGARIGVPIVSFVFGTYWDQYYRTRPWCPQRDRQHRPAREVRSRDCRRYAAATATASCLANAARRLSMVSSAAPCRRAATTYNAS